MDKFSYQLEKYLDKRSGKIFPKDNERRDAFKDAMGIIRTIERGCSGQPLAVLRGMENYKLGVNLGVFGGYDQSVAIVQKMRLEYKAGRFPKYDYSRCGGANKKEPVRSPGDRAQKREIARLKKLLDAAGISY